MYKNIFNDRKFVEVRMRIESFHDISFYDCIVCVRFQVYLAKDAEEEMGLTRDDLIALAFFLGSDYTEGVNGVGIVNAMEILQAFPMKEAYGGPLEGLARFRKWLEGYDFAKDIIEELERKRSRAQTKVTASKTKGQKGVTGRGRKSKGGDRKRRGGYSTRGISDSESEEDLNEGDAEERTEDEEDNGDAADSLKVKEETTDEGSVEISLTDLEKKMVSFYFASNLYLSLTRYIECSKCLLRLISTRDTSMVVVNGLYQPVFPTLKWHKPITTQMPIAAKRGFASINPLVQRFADFAVMS